MVQDSVHETERSFVEFPMQTLRSNDMEDLAFDEVATRPLQEPLQMLCEKHEGVIV